MVKKVIYIHFFIFQIRGVNIIHTAFLFILNKSQRELIPLPSFVSL